MPVTHFIEYLQYEKHYSGHTIKAYQADIDAFVVFLSEEYHQEDLYTVNYSQIRSWIVSLAEQDISNLSINRKISSLKSFYRFLQKSKQIEINPLSRHTALKTSKKIQIPFSEEEIVQVLQNFSTTTFEEVRDKFMIELFYSTGIRRAELIEIKLKNLDVQEQILKVKGKRNKERFIPLIKSVTDSAEIYLQKRKEVVHEKSDEYLFLTRKGVKMYDTLVYRVINNYFRGVSSKLKRSPHILRHSFATHLLNQGANINAVKELLGHSSLAATQVYTHNNISELNKIYKKAHPRNKKDKT